MLGWLVFTSTSNVLTTKNCVSLQCLLSTQPIAIHVRVPFSCDVKKLKRRSLPEIIAAINELVNTPIETTLLTNLPLAEPLRAPV